MPQLINEPNKLKTKVLDAPEKSKRIGVTIKLQIP